MAKRVWDAEMVARAAGLKRAGFSSRVIAERLGVTKSAVESRMSKAKVRLRLDGKKGGKPSLRHGPLSSLGVHKLERLDDFIEKPQGEVE